MDDLPLDGKRVLVRVDFNVSIGADGQVDQFEDYRLEATLPTIQELQQRRCKIVLLTHLGQPGANIARRDASWDLEPVHRRLQDLLHEEIRVGRHAYGSDVETVIASLEAGGILLLPNIRLEPGETTKNSSLAQRLAALADVYINESFSVSHRDHTSVALLPGLLPSCAGRRCVTEVEALSQLRSNPKRPYVAIVSGAKISTKVGMLHELLRQVDTVCVGGQIGNVLLAAAGREDAADFSASDIALAKTLLSSALHKLVLPVDVVVGPADGALLGVRTVSVDALSADSEGVWDIGATTVSRFVDICRAAKTVMWNGPVGKFETEAYQTGTFTLAEQLAAMNNYRIVGGGDTVIALRKLHLTNRFDHVSVGGGAMVAFLEGKPLPGLVPLYG